MYPHERSLIARTKDLPFVILGVNSDSDLEALPPSFIYLKITPTAEEKLLVGSRLVSRNQACK